jgi:hypothetical protein
MSGPWRCKTEGDIEWRLAQLRKALTIAQGEAYLGTLADGVPPLVACQNVIHICVSVLSVDREPIPSGFGAHGTALWRKLICRPLSPGGWSR